MPAVATQPSVVVGDASTVVAAAVAVVAGGGGAITQESRLVCLGKSERCDEGDTKKCGPKMSHPQVSHGLWRCVKVMAIYIVFLKKTIHGIRYTSPESSFVDTC